MEARFHKRVQLDLDEILLRYYEISPQLGDDFFAEFEMGIRNAEANPKYFHFDQTGLRRCNLERFPYHFLYDIRGSYIRIWVLRHDHRNPGFGTGRFTR